jgi:transcriptional regulator with XRE-family HTH domain
MQFAKILRSLIDEADVTQKHLADVINISPSTLANYVQGSRNPDYDTLIAIAKYFNVTTDYLLGFQQNAADEHQERALLQTFRSLSHDERSVYIEQGKAFARVKRKK